MFQHSIFALLEEEEETRETSLNFLKNNGGIIYIIKQLFYTEITVFRIFQEFQSFRP